MNDRILLSIARAALVFALIAFLYLATTAGGPDIARDVNDKFAHAAAFFVLALLADFSFPRSHFGLAKILPLLSYGLLIEIIQFFLPYRDASILDLLADAVGVCLYAPVFLVLLRAPFRGRRLAGVRG